METVCTAESRPRLGGILVAAKAITEDQLSAALAFQRKTNFRLGDALLQLNFTTELQIKQAVSSQLNVPFLDLETCIPDGVAALAPLIPRPYAERHRVLPIARLGESLTVAMDDPTDTAVVAEVQRLTGCTVNVVTCTRKGLRRGLNRVYGAEARDDPRASSRDAFWRG